MFSNETKEEARLSNIVGYYMNNFCEEYKGINKRSIQKFKAEFIKTAKNNCKMLSGVSFMLIID